MKFIKHYILIVFFIVFAMQPLLAQHDKIDSLLALVKIDKEDTNKVKHLRMLRQQHVAIYDFTTALEYEKKALALSQKLNWKKGEALSYRSIARITYEHGNAREALTLFSKAINLFKEINNKEWLADTYNQISYTYLDLGDFSEALKHDFMALKLYEAINDKVGIANIYFCIGTIYIDKKDYGEALINLRIALKLYNEMSDKKNISACYNNMAIIYMYQKKYDEAIKLNLLALKISQELDNKGSVAESYGNIGLIYDYQNNYTEAIKNYLIALKTDEEIDNVAGKVSSYINLGTLYTKIKKVKEADNYLNKALELSKETGDINTIKVCYDGFAQLDSLKGDFKSAFTHYKLYHLFYDSLYNTEMENKTAETVMQYEFDKKEIATKFESDKIVSDLENQNKLQKQKQLLLVVFIAVFIALVVIVLFFAKRAYDNKKKYSEVLSKENEHKELLLREVHHRVNNSLQMISSLLSIQADTTTNEEIREYLLKSENRIQAMSTMHHLLHMGNSKLEVNIQQYLGEIINFYSKVLETKPSIKLIVEIPSVNFHTKTALPLALLLNELLTNSIKYAFPNDEGDIHISLTSINDGKQWNLNIRDNGIGFKDGDIGGKGTSLGLSLVKLMVRQIGGKLNVNHSNGTSFELTFNIFSSTI